MMKASPTVLIPAALFLLALGFAAYLPAWAQGTPAMPTDAQVAAKQRQPPVLPDAGQVGTAAAKVATVLSSPELQPAKVAGYARPLKDVPVMPMSAGALDKLFAQVDKPLFPDLKPDGELLVLVSFSMPKEALQNLAQQAEKAGAVLVLRGMVNDSLAETTKAVQSLLGDKAGDSTFQVNPNVFRAYGVQDVPTFVIAKKPADGKSACELGADYVSVRGDVTLEYALRKLAENKGWDVVATRYLSAMRVKL
jgi:type-F conjugative transfer system pilin assembly protein TrbC